MTSAASKAAKPQAAKTQTPPVVASTACREKNAAAEKDIKNQQHALQAFQADVYKRDSELRERQKQLDEALTKLAEEKRKLERERAEYRWPHNGNQSNK
jgi:predicted solute-binding protein